MKSIPDRTYCKSRIAIEFLHIFSVCSMKEFEPLAGIRHLKRWGQKNTERRDALETIFREQDVLHEMAVSTQVARNQPNFRTTLHF